MGRALARFAASGFGLVLACSQQTGSRLAQDANREVLDGAAGKSVGLGERGGVGLDAPSLPGTGGWDGNDTDSGLDVALVGGDGPSNAADADDDAPTCGTRSCPMLPVCPVGYQPAPHPCACPSCAPASALDAGSAIEGAIDGGSAIDGAIDGGSSIDGDDGQIICPRTACFLNICPSGALLNPDPCVCPTCYWPPVDGGPQPDTVDASATASTCAPIVCRPLGCPYGLVPSPTPCTCPTCAPPRDDAGNVIGPVPLQCASPRCMCSECPPGTSGYIYGGAAACPMCVPNPLPPPISNDRIRLPDSF